MNERQESALRAAVTRVVKANTRYPESAVDHVVRATVKYHREASGHKVECSRLLRDDLLTTIAALEADLARWRERAEKAERERDLALAHDTQPYPTAHAYEKVCAALEKHTRLLGAAEEAIEALVEYVDVGCAHEGQETFCECSDSWCDLCDEVRRLPALLRTTKHPSFIHRLAARLALGQAEEEDGAR